ncbi:MAG: pilus assembly protein PilM [Chthonomonadales bacterium]|nr:pilus assembly protein PilM [Chthonomonadales bacterium]
MKQRTVIGIDMASHEVRASCVRQTGSGAQLLGLASAAVPPGAVAPDGILDPAAVGEVIRSVCAQLDARAAQAVIGMRGCDLVARVMEIPPVPESEVRAVLRGEMDHFRILPAGQSSFDHFRLPDAVVRDSEEAVARVLLMGAEERFVANHRATADAAGLRPSAIEPCSVAVFRALQPSVRAGETTAIVVMSSSATEIFITGRGELHLYRQIDTGAAELRSESPARDSVMPRQPLGGLLVTDADEDDAAPEPAATPAGGYHRQAISLLITEVQRSIDYYLREFPQAGETVRVQFAIDAPDATELFAVVRQYTRGTPELVTRIDDMSAAPEAAALLDRPDGARFLAAVGLALRGAGGPYTDAPTLDLGLGDRVIVERRVAPRAMLVSTAASVSILLMTTLAALVVGFSISRTQHSLKQSQAELAALTREHAARVERLDRQKTLVSVIGARSQPLREAVEFVSASIAPRACLNTLVIDSHGVIALSGEASTPRVVADVMDTINMSPRLDPVRLNGLTRLDDRDERRGLKFDLQTQFAAPPAERAPADPANVIARLGGS